MQTRSFSKTQQMSKTDVTKTYNENIVAKILDQGQYSVDIDFDEASREWSANKKRVGQMYLYVCGKMLSSGKRCQNKPGNSLDRCCKKHTDNQFDPDTLVNYFT